MAQEFRRCSNCGALNPIEAQFCRMCGTSKDGTPPQPVQRQAPQPGQAKSTWLEGGLAGLFVGVGAGIWMVIIGVILTLTGIGALIGIPLIIAGVLVAIIMPIVGAAGLKADCPYCGHRVTTSAKEVVEGGVTCSACNQRIIIRDKRFLRL